MTTASITPRPSEPAVPTQPSALRQVGTAAGMLVALTLLTGIVYPLVVTGVAKVAFPSASTGSLIVEQGKVLGSREIGQPFDDPKYLWGRPSATSPGPYDGANSAASNLGPTNPDLTKRVQERIDTLRAADPGNTAPVPVDLVTSSGSGLDPHVSPAAAEYQVGRIARARGIPEATVRAIVASKTQGRDLGVLGEPRVNVLEVNLALDRTK